MWKFDGFSGMDGSSYVGVEGSQHERTSWVCMCQRHHDKRKEIVPLWSPLTWATCVLPITITLLSIVKISPKIHNSCF